MCRMLLALGNIGTHHLVDGVIAMASDNNINHELNNQIKGTFVHDCGWSFATLNDKNDWLIRKSTNIIYQDESVWDLKPVKTKLRSFHVRKATKGNLSMNNLHHFHYESPKHGSFVMSHNGDVSDYIYFDKKFKVKGTTDSEQLFYNILTNIESGISIKKSLRNSLKNLKIFKGANLLFSTKDKSFVTVYFSENPRYYGMKLIKKKNSLIVSSEIIKLPGVDKKDWIHLKNGDLVEINHRTLDYKIYNIE